MTATDYDRSLAQAGATTRAVPYAAELIAVARQGRSFRTRELLQRIVTGEQQRIREEQMLWRMGGALVGALLGMGDGFQPADVFLGMGMSSLAGLGHEVMSQEDRRFLESCHALWTIGQNSPVELMQRLGPARSRVLLFFPQWQNPLLFDHHQGARGDYLVPLEMVESVAHGFRDPQSRAVLLRHFSQEEMTELQQQLYPNGAAAIPIQQLTPITAAVARERDLHAEAFLPATQSVQILAQGAPAVGYRVPIPAHSDY